MTKKELVEQIKLKNSYLCVGLDTDIEKLPVGLQSSFILLWQYLCISFNISLVSVGTSPTLGTGPMSQPHPDIRCPPGAEG